MLTIAAAGFHAVRLYRLADRLFENGHPRAAAFISLINRVVFAVEILPGAKFGNGFTIMHGAGLVAHSNTIAGSHLAIYQGVTIASDPANRAPQIGDHVTLFPGCILIGAIEIGSGAVINANAVVTKDVEADAFVVGINGRAKRAERPGWREIQRTQARR